MEDWKMPDWMRPYIGVIAPRKDQAYIEEMVNDKTAIQINAPRALIAVEMGGRVQMITWLKEKGLLNGYDPDRIC